MAQTWKWNLSAPETAGVVGVGVGLGFLANMFSNTQQTTEGRNRAMLAGGTALYTAGVVIGTNRPKSGYFGPAKRRKKRKKGKKRK